MPTELSPLKICSERCSSCMDRPLPFVNGLKQRRGFADLSGTGDYLDKRAVFIQPFKKGVNIFTIKIRKFHIKLQTAQ